MSQILRHLVLLTLAVAPPAESAVGQSSATLVVRVRSASQPVPQAEVRVGTLTALTDSEGRAGYAARKVDQYAAQKVGHSELTVGRFGYRPAGASIATVNSARFSVRVYRHC